MLLEKILDHFRPFRQKREELKNNLDYVKSVLKSGAIGRELLPQKLLKKLEKL